MPQPPLPVRSSRTWPRPGPGLLRRLAPRAGRVLLPALLSVATGCSGDPGRSDPEQEGLRGAALARWAAAVQRRDTSALLVLRNGRIVHEWHAWGRGADEPQPVASVAKAVVGGLALALLASDGRLALDDPAARWIPAWRDDPGRSRITLRALATHSSGLADAEHDGDPKSWAAAFWRREPDRNPMQLALAQAPLRFAPGRGFAYSNPGYAVLSVVFAAALRDAPETALPDYLGKRLFAPLGIPPEQWRLGYGTPFEAEGLETWASWGGARLSADALGRIGQMLLWRGDWHGTRVLPAERVEQLVTWSGTPLPSGDWLAPAVGWWTNAVGRWPRVPRDAFLAWGRGERVLLVVPSLDLVMVRLGGPLGSEGGRDGSWERVRSLLVEPLLEAFAPPPAPPSEVVAGAWFDPPAAMRCDAEGSDNWPITWLADGAQFAAYGDGWGFDAPGATKLSQGFARIEGGPHDFVGHNVRSPSGERTGEGPEGAKASGMLAVDGVLYMFVRNLENSQLAWSEDGGRSWTWGFRFEESFGSPTFLNFGPDYAGARDAFVYLYSQDGPSAYEADDAVVLARAPKDHVRERTAWRFYAGSGPDGTPRWSPDVAARAPVFRHPGGCRRSDVVYDPGLARYLMALGFDASGGWGIFEAPEPWGPWHTVYATQRWDLGNTHSYRLPGRWIEDGGRRLQVVVSGTTREDRVLDALCVRGLHLLPLPADALSLPRPGATP